MNANGSKLNSTSALCDSQLPRYHDRPVCILGAGLSALSFAHFSKVPAVVFEKERRIGGLCRSFDFNGISCDIGPHIFFSKNTAALDFLVSTTPMHKNRRSNKIFYKGRFVKYPFENELSALPAEKRDYCLNTFLDNPYADYPASNMLTFFYKTFGQGITRTYLEPYNRKIWKFEPSFMDTQMVARIPKPPPADIIASAQGIATEGYLHQLYFYYPDSGGAESVIKSLQKSSHPDTRFLTSAPLEKLCCKKNRTYAVWAAGRTHYFDRIFSTIPIHELIPRIDPQPPDDVKNALENLRYNSIHITLLNVTQDNLGNNFAVMVPDTEIIFHRLSKIGFLGQNYRIPGTAIIMAETTYRTGGSFDLSPQDVSQRVVRDLDRIGLVPARAVKSLKTTSFKYAYVIYDLNHRRNTDKVLAWLKSLGITSFGRFGAFEYINTDAAITQAKTLAHRFCDSISKELI